MSDEFDLDNVVISTRPPKPENLQAKGICVVLEEDTDKRKIEELLSAIKQLKGVLAADWIDYDFDDRCNRIRMKQEFKEELKKGLEF